MRIALRKIAIDVGVAESLVLDLRGDVGRSFADELGPLYRWLETQVGRPWTNVYGEIRRTFDFRTTAGRHIVDRISGCVNMHREACAQIGLFSPRFDFEINEHGILVLGTWRHGRPRTPTPGVGSATRARP